MGWWLVNNGKPLCLYNQQPPNSPFRSGISTISKGIYVFWLYIHLYKYFKYQVKKQQYVWYKKITVEKKLRETTELFFLTWTSKLDWSCHCNTSLLTLAKCRKSEPTIWGMDCLAICKVRNVAISSSLNMANLR